MATVTGLTATTMQQIVDNSVESATIQGSTLIFTRHDGSSFAAGDFASFISGQVNSAVAAAVPAAVVGGFTAQGNISGTVAFPGLTPAQMVNRLFSAYLVGNITINADQFPTPTLTGTQFAMVLHQDGTGSRTLTLVNCKRSQGVLTLSTAPNAIDIISFINDGQFWYAGAMGLNFV